jgi:hypothetical protein
MSSRRALSMQHNTIVRCARLAGLSVDGRYGCRQIGARACPAIARQQILWMAARVPVGAEVGSRGRLPPPLPRSFWAAGLRCQQRGATCGTAARPCRRRRRKWRPDWSGQRRGRRNTRAETARPRALSGVTHTRRDGKHRPPRPPATSPSHGEYVPVNRMPEECWNLASGRPGRTWDRGHVDSHRFGGNSSDTARQRQAMPYAPAAQQDL